MVVKKMKVYMHATPFAELIQIIFSNDTGGGGPRVYDSKNHVEISLQTERQANGFWFFYHLMKQTHSLQSPW